MFSPARLRAPVDTPGSGRHNRCPMEFDLIIVGGGLAGLSLACALRAAPKHSVTGAPLKIALVEGHAPQRPAGWDARIYAISPTNAAFLERIGAWQHLDKSRLASVQAMDIAGDADGRLRFSAYDTGVSELAWIVESSLMACELWETAKRQANISLFCPHRPSAVSFDADAARLTLDDGQVLSAKLLVGADGRDSWVRGQAGLEAITTPYCEMGLVANFRCAKPHCGTAYQWFRDDGILAYLPLPEQQISIVWSTPDAHAAELLALPPQALCERVAAAGQYTLGELELVTPAAAFPLRLIRVPEIVAPRLALIGDAAHGIHPLSGHGINLGYQDAATLADELLAASPWQDIGACADSATLLRRYQRARREQIMLLQGTTHAINRLFRTEFPGLKPLRNLGLAVTNRLPFVKSALIRYALES